MDAPAPVSASAVFASGDDAMFSIRLTASRSDRRCTPPFVHIATRVRPILPDTRPTSIRTLSFGRPLLSAVTRINTVPAHIQSIRSRASKVSNLRGNSSTMHLPTTPGRLVNTARLVTPELDLPTKILQISIYRQPLGRGDCCGPTIVSGVKSLVVQFFEALTQFWCSVYGSLNSGSGVGTRVGWRSLLRNAPRLIHGERDRNEALYHLSHALVCGREDGQTAISMAITLSVW